MAFDNLCAQAMLLSSHRQTSSCCGCRCHTALVPLEVSGLRRFAAQNEAKE
jgi:hypothetical protein